MQIVCFALHLLSPPLQHFIGNVCVCVCVCNYVCVSVYAGGLFACLLFAPLFLADRDSLAPLSPPVTMTEREQVRGKNCAICLQRGVDTRRERALQTLTPLTTSVPHPCQAHKGQREHNETVIINTIRAEQAADTLAALPKWPLLSKPLRVDLPNVRQKSKTGPEAVKQDIAWGKKRKRKNL